MKKFWALIGMLICVFGLAACGGEETLTEFEQFKVDAAISKAKTRVLPALDALAQDDTTSELKEYTAQEVAYSIYNIFKFETDGNAFRGAMDSFTLAYDEIGAIVYNDDGTPVETADAKAVIDGDQIIVNLYLKCASKDAVAEVVFSNDVFLSM